MLHNSTAVGLSISNFSIGKKCSVLDPGKQRRRVKILYRFKHCDMEK